MKFDWKVGIGFLVSAFFLWWAFRGEDLGDIGHRILQADFWLLLASIAVGTAGYFIRAMRWKLFLAPLRVPTKLRSRWESIIIGFMVINIWPARLGEFVRPIVLARLEPVPAAGVLGTVVLERALDAIALLILLGVALSAPSFPSEATVMGRPIEFAASLALIGVATILAAIGVLIFKPKVALAVMRPVTTRLAGGLGERIESAVETFATGLELLREPKALLATLFWSLFLWLWMASSFWLAFLAFDLDLGFTAAIFTQCAVAIFVSVPAGPGFIGTFEAGVKVALIEGYGMGAEETLSVATAYHIGGAIPVTLLGIWYAWRLGVDVRSIEAEASLPDDRPT